MNRCWCFSTIGNVRDCLLLSNSSNKSGLLNYDLKSSQQSHYLIFSLVTFLNKLTDHVNLFHKNRHQRKEKIKTFIMNGCGCTCPDGGFL